MNNTNLGLVSDGITQVLYYLDDYTIRRIYHNENLTRTRHSEQLTPEEMTINSAILDMCEQILETRNA